MDDKIWNSGSGVKKTFNDILEEAKEHSKFNGTVYIGTDSFFRKDQCIFSNAICSVSYTHLTLPTTPYV